ncbi:MAG TPA: MBL fold metallo-hydrolase, partial [Spirochaetota bacterium]
MRKVCIAIMLCLPFPLFSASSDDVTDVMKRIKWLGGSTVSLESRSGVVIYVDLADCTPSKKGDVILYTHPHGDHYVPGIAEDVAQPAALIAAPFEIPSGKIIKIGETIDRKDVRIMAVPAYNIKKAGLHPKE